jgi:DNA (cytosine-5)-methyltransferase 1
VIVIGYRPKRVDTITEQDITALQQATSPTVYDAIHDLPGPMTVSPNGDTQHYARYDREPEKGVTGTYARRARRQPAEGLASAEVRQRVKSGLISGFNPTHHTAVVCKRFSKLGEGERDSVSKCPRLAWDEPCPTLRAGTGADRGSYQSIRPIHPRENRVITIREAARLQGFPDWFQFHATQWHSFRMIGNSISPMVATAILELLRNSTEA